MVRIVIVGFIGSLPSGRTDFLPDPRVWAVLYAWRTPGFDIDGDGFVGVPNLSSTLGKTDDPETATVALQGSLLVDTAKVASTRDIDDPFDDRIDLAEDTGTTDGTDDQQQVIDDEPTLNGRITAPEGFPTFPCGTMGLLPVRD